MLFNVNLNKGFSIAKLKVIGTLPLSIFLSSSIVR